MSHSRVYDYYVTHTFYIDNLVQPFSYIRADLVDLATIILYNRFPVSGLSNSADLVFFVTII